MRIDFNAEELGIIPDCLRDYRVYKPEYLTREYIDGNLRLELEGEEIDASGRIYVIFKSNEGDRIFMDYFGDGVFRMESCKGGFSKVFDVHDERYVKYLRENKYIIVINAIMRDFLRFRDKRFAMGYPARGVVM